MSGTFANYATMAFEAVENFDRLSNPAEIVAHMRSVLGTFGYTGFLITNTPEASAGGERQTILDGWPNQFNEHYVERNFYKDDPIAAHARRTFEAFEWKDVVVDHKADPLAADVMGAAADVGLRQGFAIPIFLQDNVIDTVTMAGEQPDFDPLAKRAITMIGLYAHAKAMSLMAKSIYERPKKLSPAESEAITWVAVGKTSGEIAIILGISESAVVKRIDHAMKKLNAVTRAQAATTALLRREIRL